MERQCRVVTTALFGAAMVWVPNAEAEQVQVSGLTGTALLEACRAEIQAITGFAWAISPASRTPFRPAASARRSPPAFLHP